MGVLGGLRPGVEPSEELRQILVNAVTSELGKPLKPGFVRFTTKLPKTRNSKVMRRLIKAAWLKKELGDVSSLEDPGALDAIRVAQ